MPNPSPAQPALPTCCTMLSLPASTHQTVCSSMPEFKGVVALRGSGPPEPPFGAPRSGPSAIFFLLSGAQRGLVHKQQARWVPMAQQAPVPAPSPGQPALRPCCTYPSAPTFPPAPPALLHLLLRTYLSTRPHRPSYVAQGPSYQRRRACCGHLTL